MIEIQALADGADARATILSANAKRRHQSEGAAVSTAGHGAGALLPAPPPELNGADRVAYSLPVAHSFHAKE